MATSPTRPSTSEPGVLERLARRKVDLWIVAAAATAYATLGYGNDNDTYHMIDTWERWRATGVYHASRGTGYPIPEFAIGFLSSLGGSLVSNLASLALCLVVVVLLRRWLLSIGAGDRVAALAVLCVGLQPVWFIASATSMDYPYALAGFAGGVALLAVGRPWLAAVALAIAVASRITYLPLALLVFWIARVTIGSPIRPALLTAVLSALAYVPASLAAGGGLRFLVMHENAPFSLPRAVANWGLQHLTFWGLPAMILLAAAAWRWRPRREPKYRLFVPATLAASALWFEVFFLRLPAEPAYLLPVLPAVVGLLAWTCRREPVRASTWLVGLLVLELTHAVVQLTPLRRPEPAMTHLLFSTAPVFTSSHQVTLRSEGGARSAIGLFAEEGPLAADLSNRLRAQREWLIWLRRTYPAHFE